MPSCEEVEIAYRFLGLPKGLPFKETEEKVHSIRLSLIAAVSLSDNQRNRLLEAVKSCWQVIEMDYRSKDCNLFSSGVKSLP